MPCSPRPILPPPRSPVKRRLPKRNRRAIMDKVYVPGGGRPCVWSIRERNRLRKSCLRQERLPFARWMARAMSRSTGGRTSLSRATTFRPYACCWEIHPSGATSVWSILTHPFPPTRSSAPEAPARPPSAGANAISSPTRTPGPAPTISNSSEKGWSCCTNSSRTTAPSTSISIARWDITSKLLWTKSLARRTSSRTSPASSAIPKTLPAGPMETSGIWSWSIPRPPGTCGMTPERSSPKRTSAGSSPAWMPRDGATRRLRCMPPAKPETAPPARSGAGFGRRQDGTGAILPKNWSGWTERG